MTILVTTLPDMINATKIARHPNELDLRRITSMLEKRARYRYVCVNVIPANSGYLVVSPCCSRTVEPDGGMIDIALIEFEESSNRWRLFSKDHHYDKWRLHIITEKLGQLMDCLNEDPARVFWQ